MGLGGSSQRRREQECDERVVRMTAMNNQLRNAAYNGLEDEVYRLITIGANDIEGAFQSAVEGEANELAIQLYDDIVEASIQVDRQRAFITAIRHENVPLVNYFLQQKFLTNNTIRSAACQSNSFDIRELLCIRG